MFDFGGIDLMTLLLYVIMEAGVLVSTEVGVVIISMKISRVLFKLNRPC